MSITLPTWPQGALQPEAPFNESMKKLGAVVNAAAEATTNTPPTTTLTDVGKIWIISTSPTGAWTGRANQIALCTAADVWEFYAPETGWLALDKNTGLIRFWNGSSWGAVPLGTAAVDRNVVTALATSGAVNIDVSLGDYFTLALAGNVTSLTFSNLPASGKAVSLLVRIKQDTTPRTVTWPASFKWAEGNTIAVSTVSGSIDVLAITTFDQGTTWQVTLAKAFA